MVTRDLHSVDPLPVSSSFNFHNHFTYEETRPQEDSNLPKCERRKGALPQPRKPSQKPAGEGATKPHKNSVILAKVSPVPQPEVAGREYHRGQPGSSDNGHL